MDGISRKWETAGILSAAILIGGGFVVLAVGAAKAEMAKAHAADRMADAYEADMSQYQMHLEVQTPYWNWQPMGGE